MRMPILKRSSAWIVVAVGLAFSATSILVAAEKPKDKRKAAQAERKRPAAEAMPELSAEAVQKIEAALPERATAKPKKPRKVLVFWRCEGFFHGGGIAGGTKAIELLGKKTGAWTTDVTREYADLSAENLAKYDVLVLNNTTRLKLPDAQKQALLDFVQGGKGLVGIHAATDNFYDWPEGGKLMGGVFAGHPWGGGGTWAFKLDEPDHVLLAAFGGKGFKLKDEIYQFKEAYSRANQRVLVSLDLSDPATGKVKGGRDDNDYAVAWIKNVGKGRLFYCSLGHDANVFQDPAVVRFYLDGLQFAAGDLEADATPKK
ncbi:MAG: ThuA domain-containing protein [Thermoguttaceae bacterium]|nr:ThuA domain-containing protein [Thermoguttaceae bacterium]